MKCHIYIYIHILLGCNKVWSRRFIFGICCTKFRHPNDDWVLELDQNTTYGSQLPERPNPHSATIL